MTIERRKNDRRGLLMILSSPSGAGKSTLAKRLRAWDTTISFSVSATTRPPRVGEVDKFDYHFVTEDAFKTMVNNDEMLEHAHVFGNFYGSPTAPVRAAIEHGNDVLFDHRQVTRNHVEETVRLADAVAAGEQPRPDLVVWPENSTAVDPFLDAETNQGIERAVAAIGVPVLVGAIVDDGPEHVLNQGIVWDPATGPGERYTKWHPVPYGEYIPFRQYLDVNFGELARIRRDMRAGDRTEPLEVGPIRLADAICFDVAYDDGLHAQVREGAELLTVQTSNATFIFTDQVDQQFAITRLRAIEAGKWLVVASTNGRSGIIAPDGRVVETVDRRTTATMLAEVELLPGVSPGIHLTPWVTRGVVALTLLGLLLVLIASGAVTRRSRTVAPEYADAGS